MYALNIFFFNKVQRHRSLPRSPDWPRQPVVPATSYFLSHFPWPVGGIEWEVVSTDPIGKQPGGAHLRGGSGVKTPCPHGLEMPGNSGHYQESGRAVLISGWKGEPC